MIKVIKNVLSLQDSFELYEGIINQNMWNLNRASEPGKPRGAFPGVTFLENGEVLYNDPYWIGYFNCLYDRINQGLSEQHNFKLARKIQRIALNAQNDNHYTEFHIDTATGKGPSHHSIVGFLTPQWAEDWGGELNIEGEIFKYSPGDFVLFDSTKRHRSQEIKKIPYWRISVSYMTLNV
jgi:hypothetical protein|tara:strand:- start:1795 stop:2334 length:540 start_codon:yes stop_codon:yes gene_type:complete